MPTNQDIFGTGGFEKLRLPVVKAKNAREALRKCSRMEKWYDSKGYDYCVGAGIRRIPTLIMFVQTPDGKKFHRAIEFDSEKVE
jgi:hypothetical protein